MTPRASAAYAVLAARTLTDADVGDIIRLLDDRDWRVAAGAAVLLGQAGMRARAAAPHLITIMKTSTKEEAKWRVALALVYLVDYNQVSQLKDLLRNEDSDKVRRRIENIIKVIELRH